MIRVTLRPRCRFGLGLVAAVALAALTAFGSPTGHAAPATGDPTGACPWSPHRVETIALFAGPLGRRAEALVYLPPGYDCRPDRRYAVFYLQDGQDLFARDPRAADLPPAVALELDRRDGWYGSWSLAARLDRAILEGRIPATIVVGIASDTGPRAAELVPVAWRGAAEGRGEAYGAFLAGTLVPAIDTLYRTIPDRRCRGVGGASLGGVAALQAGLAHRDVFGLVLALSPVLGDPAIADYVAHAWASAPAGAGPSTLLVDFDDDRIGDRDRRWLAAMAATSGAEGLRTLMVRRPGTRHAIDSWSERAIPGLTRLLGARCRAGEAPTPP
ncbi:MAG: alpha/beta hydrolase-fold protein [Azospirillaceae bacterium]